MRRLVRAVAPALLLAGCGALVPATQSPKPLGVIVSSAATPSATASVGSPMAAATPSPAPSPTKPPFVPTPYSAPGPPTTLNNEQAQATRTSYERQIAEADQRLRRVTFSPQATAVR
jgi:hypothetical protein